MSRGEKLLNMLGNFWSNLYGGWNQLASVIHAKNQVELQAYQDLLEAIQCLSRIEIPLYHKKYWSLLTIKQSEQQPGKLLKYGDDAQFGNNQNNNGVIYKFGVSPYRTYDWLIDSRLAKCFTITDQITKPNVIFTYNNDYILEDGTIRFRDNPFSNNSISKKPIFDETGSVVDYEIHLWLFMAEYDLEYLYEQFGYALDVYLSSSENYKKILNSIWDSVIVGESLENLEVFLSALTDTPLIISNTETVTDIYATSVDRLIVTDKSLYRVPLDATLIVSVGDILKKGNRITDAFTIHRPYGINITESDIQAVSVGKGLLIGNFTSDLSFLNKTVDLDVTIDSNDRTRVEFEIGGLYSDIKLFWDTVHSNGTAEDAISLAQLLDSRYPPAQSPDPTAVNLPLTINPLEFLVKNVLRNNALIVQFNVGSFGPDSIGTTNPALFRRIVPPQATIIIINQLQFEDIVTMSGIGNSSTTGYTEDLDPTAFICPSILSETSPHTFVDTEVITISLIPE
jgi:hypothetical protein